MTFPPSHAIIILNHPLLLLVSLLSLAALSCSFSWPQGLLLFDKNTRAKSSKTFLPVERRSKEAMTDTDSFVDLGSPNSVANPVGDSKRHQHSSSICESDGGFDDNDGLHRRRTIYLIRHGEAEHNVLEKIAQKKAEAEAKALNLSPEETHERMEDARKLVLQDKSLRDAPLTEKGRQQARETSNKLKELIADEVIHHPTEAMCSPLSRCLETCKVILEDQDLKAHIRPEIAERRTLYPPDKPKPLDQLLRCTREDDRFSIENMEQLLPETIRDEALVRESKEMLRERAGEMFDLLMECDHRHVLVVSHKGFLRELERGLFGIPDSPLFDNCELRVYRLIFTMGDRQLFHLERMA